MWAFGMGCWSIPRCSQRCKRVRGGGWFVWLCMPILKDLQVSFSIVDCQTQAMSTTDSALQPAIDSARLALDAHTREIVRWHFDEATGCPFWLGKKSELKFDPLKEIETYEDLKKFPNFEDEWLRGGPVRRWVPKGLSGQSGLCFRNRRDDGRSQKSNCD